MDVDDEREEAAAVSPTMETNGSSSGRHITQHPKTAPTTYHHLIQELESSVSLSLLLIRLLYAQQLNPGGFPQAT